MAMEITRASGTPRPPEVDPVVLPRSVRRQRDRSTELQQQLQPNSGGDNPPTPAPADPTAAPTPLQPTMGGAQPGPATGQQEPSHQNGAAVPPAAPPVAATPPGEPAPSSPPEDWEQRFRSLEGRYRSDMQRSAERVMQLEREAQGRPITAPVAPEQPLLTPEEIADYGPEFVDLVRRAATEAGRPMQQRIAQLEAELTANNRRIAVSANDRMHEFMNRAIPEWAAINNHPDFVAWSHLPDIYSGVIRQTLMQDAWNKGDGPRVEAFFRGFLAEQGVPVPQTPVPPAAPVQPQPRPNGSAAPLQPRVTLESLAAPGRARSAPPQPADKPVYTQAQILKFYTDVATGRFQGSEQDRAAIDADIIAAQHEGRILVDTRLATQPPPGFTR